MNKKMRELLTKIQEKTVQAKAFMEGENKDLEKANAIMDEVDSLQKEYETEKRLYESEKMTGAQSATTPVEPKGQETETKDITGEEMIAKQIRAIMAPSKYGNDKGLMESVDEDGGYTVPEDIQTAVNHWPEAEASFLAEISEESVSTIKGARTYQKKADTEAFIDIDENGEITQESPAPKFERITYQIQDRAGFMPVSNNLVNDSDANIMGIVTAWLGRANIATANAKIKEILNAHKNPKGAGQYETTGGMVTDLKNIDGIKKVVTVVLGQAYKSGAKIITNDDGLHYLDTLKDQNGRPLLNPDPTDSAKLTLRCGSVVVPVSVKPNKGFESNGTKVPFIVGDLKAGIKMTLIRAILRDDYKELDKDAYVYGYIDTSVVGE